MADQARIIGGPLDGYTTSRGDKYVFLEVQVVKRSEPGPGRELYEMIDGEYVAAGDRVVRCTCGGFVRKVEGGAERQSCPVCGAGATMEASR